MSEITEEMVRTAGGISVLIEELVEQITSANGNSATASISVGPYPIGTIVHINARGTAKYQGPLGNAGIVLRVSQDERLLTTQDSFEGESANIGFATAASSTVFLPASEEARITADVNYKGSAGQNNKRTQINLRVLPVAAIKLR